jgi:hypothetical protein
MSERRRVSRTACAWIGVALLAASLTSLDSAASAQAGATSAAAPGSAQSLPKPRLRSLPAAPEESLRLMVFSLERKSIFDALEVVRPLLSVQGSVELDPTHNTISVRDNLAALSRVSTAIRAFDRENRPVQVHVSLILAETAKISPIRPSTGIAPDLLERLRQLLRFDNFSLLAQSQITSREGEAVVYDMAQGYRLSFELGAVGDGNRIRLGGFRMVRALPGQPEHELLRSVVNLGVGQPLILGLTRNEAADRALMLVLRYERPATVAAGR